MKRKFLIILLVVAVSIPLISLSVSAMSKEMISKKHHKTILGKKYSFIEQLHLNKNQNSFIKLDFNNYNKYKRNKMKKLNYYSGLFTEKDSDKIKIYYNQALRNFNAQYGKPLLLKNKDLIKLDGKNFKNVFIWGPTNNGRLIVMQLHKLNKYYWMQYSILYN